jgi:hypothetical protein
LDQPNYGAVINLGKSLIRLTDCIKWLWLDENDYLVRSAMQRGGHREGCNGYRDDKTTRSLRPQRGCGRQ